MMRKAEKAGLAFGFFDLLHIGHLKFLQKCKEYCEFLIIGVFTDEVAALYKRKPILPFNERAELVRAMKPVNRAFKAENTVSTSMLKTLIEDGFDIIFIFHREGLKPEEWGGQMVWKDVEDYIKSIGGKMIIIPYYKPRSTTGIINEIHRREAEGDI